ncbi:hypothetical protein BKH42_08130 [Helicobacter sp. 13S00482-2]|uniref:outer membrane beta-barrel protein n=1 Tax=Helicobacter sp. 13S00482-2 TaxID=1476200 RepID=UPI000BA6C767|nr:outer membrane beta-barrel protein [Helicobacter sp. 13S00482-2]PAF53048.1 hypothetical protein BKH42_08130 [Helicobacter sp. 13S00482-2]
MKRSLFSIFFVGILGMSALQANEKSGVFIGADIGFAMNSGSGSVDAGDYGSAKSVTVVFNMSYGVRAGYQQYFGNYNGLRLYGNFNYLHFGSDAMMKYGANLDYLLNFSDSDSPWGIFAGVGYEWVGGEAKDSLSKSKQSAIEGRTIATDGLLVNVGFSKIINNHNRIEFGAKIPLYNYDKIETPIVKATTHTLATVYVAYSYSF